MKQAKAKIFLENERGVNEGSGCNSRSTFNFGNYRRESKQPFGDIYVVNDDALDAAASLEMQVNVCSYILLVPVMGAVVCRHAGEKEQLIAAGQVYTFLVGEQESFVISNPFEEGVVNVLQVWVRAGETGYVQASCLSTYDVNKYIDRFTAVLPVPGGLLLPFALSIGKFNGRGETVYHCTHDRPGLFAFAVSGAFEIAGRLLHPRDSLALWETGSAEVEALSNEAIMLLLEIPFNGRA